MGQSRPRWKWSYAPTDFVVNDPIEISINSKDMYIKRAGGQELKTKVIDAIGHCTQNPLAFQKGRSRGRPNSLILQSPNCQF